jgi:hypothetical protein
MTIERTVLTFSKTTIVQRTPYTDSSGRAAVPLIARVAVGAAACRALEPRGTPALEAAHELFAPRPSERFPSWRAALLFAATSSTEGPA